MTGQVVVTHLSGGIVRGDDGEIYHFAWHRSIARPPEIGHGSPISFSIVQTNGRPEAVRISIDHERFNQQPAKQKKKRFIPATSR